MNQYIPYVIRKKPVEPVPTPPPKYRPFRVDPRRARMDEIVYEEAAEHGVTYEDIMSKSRQRDVCWARHDAIYRIYSEMNISTPRLGAYFGGRDHSTIVHALWRGGLRNEMYVAIKMAVEGRLKVSKIE